MSDPGYFHQSLIDPALTRDVARLRAEHGPLGLDLPEAASQGHPVEAPHFGVTIPASLVRAAEDLGVWPTSMPLLWDGDQA